MVYKKFSGTQGRDGGRVGERGERVGVATVHVYSYGILGREEGWEGRRVLLKRIFQWLLNSYASAGFANQSLLTILSGKTFLITSFALQRI